MKFNIYWKFWWAMTWRAYLITFILVAPFYLINAFYADDIEAAIQSSQTIMILSGPFIQVYVLKRLFTKSHKSFSACLNELN